MSIARAVAEYTAGKKLGAKTMFATHYHELTSLEGEIKGVVNCNVAAKKRGEDVTFLRKIVPGPADDSYGIEVARLAGVPAEVTKRAKTVLASLEARAEEAERAMEEKAGKGKSAKSEPEQAPVSMTFEDAAADGIKEALRKTDINTLTPIEALNLIYEWKKLL